MRWSWKVGAIAGIGLYVHATFLLIVGWVGLSSWSQDHSLAAALAAVIFVLALFACVVLHELGHALTARKFGIRTRDITLLPIGGVARLERMPDDPRQELWVALAGPAVNVAIAALLGCWLLLSGATEWLAGVSLTGGSFLQRMLALNLVLALFNMIPAFPMDGGRVLRALLATRMEYTRATQYAAALGQALAFVFGFVGFFSNPFLLFIALFVWIGAEQETSMVQMRSALGGIPVRQAMVTDFRTLAPHDSLQRAIELILSGSQQDFPVTDDGHVRGVLTRADLMLALAQQAGPTVADVMRSEFQVADPSEMLETAFRRLQDCACRVLPVVNRGELVGLLTAENVGEFLMIQAALEKARARVR